MKAQPSCEQTIAISILHHVVLAQASRGKHAGHHFSPHIQVSLCIGCYRGLARCAAGGMDAYNLLFGNGQKAKRISISEVMLGSKGYFLQVSQRTDAVRS